MVEVPEHRRDGVVESLGHRWPFGGDEAQFRRDRPNEVAVTLGQCLDQGVGRPVAHCHRRVGVGTRPGHRGQPLDGDRPGGTGLVYEDGQSVDGPTEFGRGECPGATPQSAGATMSQAGAEIAGKSQSHEARFGLPAPKRVVTTRTCRSTS